MRHAFKPVRGSKLRSVRAQVTTLPTHVQESLEAELGIQGWEKNGGSPGLVSFVDLDNVKFEARYLGH